MQTLRGLIVAVAVAASSGACAPAAEQARSEFPARSKTTLVVQNANWSDIAVYLVRGPMKMRMGSVTSMGKATFAIPDSYVLGVSDIKIQADPLGSGQTWVSPPIQVFPGAQVALKVENAIRLTNFAVYGTH